MLAWFEKEEVLCSTSSASVPSAVHKRAGKGNRDTKGMRPKMQPRMRRLTALEITRSLLVMLMLVFMGVPSAYAHAGEPGSVARGRAFAKAHCSSCHAVGHTGRSPYRPAPPLRTLNNKYDVEGLAEAFAEGIIVGHKGERQMPEFVLQPGEIDDLIAYLKSLKPRKKGRH